MTRLIRSGLSFGIILIISCLFVSCSSDVVEDVLAESLETPVVTVLSVSPENDVLNIPITTTIQFQFSATMNAETVSVNVMDATCSGTIQVSSDNFTTCIRMATAIPAVNAAVFTITPTPSLSYVTNYSVKVLADVSDIDGFFMAANFESSFTTVALDTDGDGISDALDSDDDGDEILTKDEYDVDGDGVPDDSDGDGTPDYLDND